MLVEPSPLRHHPRVSSTPLPSLDPIKGKAGDPPREKDEKPQDIPQLLKINISSNILFFPFLETWDRLPLSRLVTPTQALRCKEIQNSSPRWT
jgi:hypothetical protein